MKPEGVRFAAAGNIMGVDRPRSPWLKHFGSRLGASQLAPPPPSSSTLSPLGRSPSKKAVVVSLPTIESSYVAHTAKGILGFKHPDYPALRVASEVLNATESYLWRYIRGLGLAYGAYVSVDNEAGHISFSLYRSSNSMEGYKQASTVLKGLVDGSIELEETTIDAAKSSIVYGVARSVSTAGRAAAISFVNRALKGVPQDYTVQLLEKFQAVTKDDILKSLEKYFLPLFDPKTSVAAVVTAPGKADEIAAGLKEVGFEVEQKTLEADPEDDDGDSSCSDDEMSDGESDSVSDGGHR